MRFGTHNRRLDGGANVDNGIRQMQKLRNKNRVKHYKEKHFLQRETKTNWHRRQGARRLYTQGRTDNQAQV